MTDSPGRLLRISIVDPRLWRVDDIPRLFVKRADPNTAIGLVATARTSRVMNSRYIAAALKLDTFESLARVTRSVSMMPSGHQTLADTSRCYDAEMTAIPNKTNRSLYSQH
jgi:hypothetical protein